MAALVDTNILVYRHDPRDTAKGQRARNLLRAGVDEGTIHIAYQALEEFVSVVTRPLPGLGPLLSPADARWETEDLLRQFPVLYPDAHLVRVALQGMAAYELPWWDAQMWAYAEVNGLETFWSEDYQHGRWYGGVRVLNPFVSEDDGSSNHRGARSGM